MNMASISQPLPRPPPCFYGGCGLISMSSSPVTLSFPLGMSGLVQFHVGAVRTELEGWRIRSSESYGSDLLRRPSISLEKDFGSISQEVESGDEREVEESVDWEDRILEDTVPLVGFVRMVLHSGRYESGDRLSPEHESTILERLLPYHPEFEKKTESGIDYITVGHHPDFESSRCLFIVRKDGEFVDFSYWKCIKGLIRKNYPSYADSFILRHFRRRRQNG